MWRAVQTIPRAIRQQWNCSVRSAPQTVHVDQDDPNGLKKVALLHRSYLPNHQNGCLDQWWNKDSDEKDGDKEWKLPGGQNTRLEAVGWGTAILLGIQLSKIYHQNASREKRRESAPCCLSPEEFCPLKWLQHLTSTRRTVCSITDGQVRRKTIKPKVLNDASYTSNNSHFSFPPYDVGSEDNIVVSGEEKEDLDFESLLDVVYNAEETTFRGLDEFKEDCASISEDKQEQEAAASKPEAKAQQELEEAMEDWVRLTGRCSILAHHQLAYSHLQAGSPSRAFLLWQQAFQEEGDPHKQPTDSHLQPDSPSRAFLLWQQTRLGKEIPQECKTESDSLTGCLGSVHYNLGLCYELGSGTETNPEMARKHYSIAAAEGHVQAMYNMAVYCLKGEGGDRDVELALTLLQTAAKRGLREASRDLDVLMGKGNQKEMETACGLYLEAADVDDISGQFHLGMCYSNGWGVPQDDVKALELFSSASKSGHPEALHRLALYTEKGLGGLNADKRNALALFRKAAKAGLESSNEHIQRLIRDLNEEKFQMEINKLLGAKEYTHGSMTKSKSSPVLRRASLTFYIRENLHDFGPNIFESEVENPSILESYNKPPGHESYITRNRTVNLFNIDSNEDVLQLENVESHLNEKVSFKIGDGEEYFEPTTTVGIVREKTKPALNVSGGFGDVPLKRKIERSNLERQVPIQDSGGMNFDVCNKEEMRIVVCS